MADNESAKNLLDNLSNLMSSIEASNKPQSVNIHLRGGYGFARFIGVFAIIAGVVVFLTSLGLVISTMLALPTTTGIALRLMAATQSLGGLFSGLILLAAGAITKASVDTADYNAQMLQLTKKRMEKR